MSSSLEKLVSVFDGSNYLAWSDSMRAWLRSQGYWQVVSGAEKKPVLPPQATTAQTAEVGSSIMAWENKNDQAFGSIILCLAPSLRQRANAKATAKQVWELLATDYGVDGPSQAFIDFRTAITIKILANNPSPSISQMADKFQRLTAQNITIPELVQAMVLLAVMPRDFDSLSSTVLSMTETSQLTFKLVRDHIVTEHNRRLAVGKPRAPLQVNKLSAVKRKGANPKWQPKNKQQSELKDSDDKKPDSAHRGCRAGKQVKERKEKAQDKRQNQHSHLASMAVEAGPSAPAFTTIMGSGTVILLAQLAIVNKPLKQHLTYAQVTDPRKRPAPQAFTGAMIGTPSVFEGYQEARDTLAALDLAQSVQHLRLLEEWIAIWEGKRRKVDETASETNVEIQTDIVMGSDEIPYPISNEEIWNSVDDRLAEELDSMGPYIGGYDERSVQISTDSQAPINAMVVVCSSTKFGTKDVDTIMQPYDINGMTIHCLHKHKREFCAKCLDGNCDTCVDWILDSGASKHFSGDINDFASYQDVDPNKDTHVHAANSVIHIKGKGAVFIKHQVKIQGKLESCITRLYPVFYIPKIDYRLLSMGIFLQRGYLVNGSKQEITIVDKNTRTPVLWCTPQKSKDTIYQACMHIMCTKDHILGATIFVADFKIWHKRLRHPSKQAIERMPEHTLRFPQNLIIPKDILICSGCAKGKMTSQSFPESSSWATHPFELIHSDLKEMPTLSYNKAKYFIVFLDDHTSHIWTANLKHKSDAKKAMQNLIAYTKTQDGAKIKRWRFDAGGEFCDQELLDMLKGKGIIVEMMAPHAHQQNGHAECAIRTISEKAQALRFTACLPPSWWNFCVNHAVHLYNQMPLAWVKWITPIELRTGEKPDLMDLKVFGCAAYVFLPIEKRVNKMSPRSELMTYLSYEAGTKGYLFMRPSGSTFIGTQAIFDEMLFPQCGNAPAPSITDLGDFPPEEPEDHNHSDGTDGNEDDQSPPTDLHLPESSGEDDGYMKEEPDAQTDAADEPPRSPPVTSHDFEPHRDDQCEWQQLPHRSGRTRNPPNCPGNTYGEQRLPSDIERDIMRGRYWRRAMGQDSDSNWTWPRTQPWSDTGSGQAPVTDMHYSNNQEEPDHLMTGMDDVVYIIKIAREGGMDLMRWLLAKAITPSIAKDQVPIQFRDIACLQAQQQAEWKRACRDELEALKKRQVYEIVDLPHGRKAIKNRWVFAIKGDGWKWARLMAKGFSQVEGVDFDKIFSPVVRYETVRLMFAFASLEGMYMTGLDVKTAFLYGKLEEEIYMLQPEGFVLKGKERKVMRLKRALYGLKQAALAWWKELESFMWMIGFVRTSSDTGIFIYKCPTTGTLVIALVYIDDGLFMGMNKKLVDEKKASCMKQWECRGIDNITEFLGMRIKQSASKVSIDQRAYLTKVLQQFNMTNAKTAPTPLPTGYTPLENTAEPDSKLWTQYQSVIRSLLYLMLGTRPDIAYAVIKMSQFLANPSQEHLDKAMYIMHYLVGIQDYQIVYYGDKSKGLLAYTDSDWAADPIKRQSTMGFFVTLASSIVCWQSCLQKTVALSSTEAEYMALSDTCHQILWIQSLFGELGYTLTRIPICGNNQGSIFIGSNPVQERCTKHIDICYHYICKCIENDKVMVVFIPGNNNLADMFTKNLGAIKFVKFRDSLGIEFEVQSK
jgi:transposase InsO family protein